MFFSWGECPSCANRLALWFESNIGPLPSFRDGNFLLRLWGGGVIEDWITGSMTYTPPPSSQLTPLKHGGVCHRKYNYIMLYILCFYIKNVILWTIIMRYMPLPPSSGISAHPDSTYGSIYGSINHGAICFTAPWINTAPTLNPRTAWRPTISATAASKVGRSKMSFVAGVKLW